MCYLVFDKIIEQTIKLFFTQSNQNYFGEKRFSKYIYIHIYIYIRVCVHMHACVNINKKERNIGNKVSFDLPLS